MLEFSNNRTQLRFEQGPIRPPSEARSLLIRFTRNCPWNKCTFCPIYKHQKFSRRSKKEIKRDIDAISEIISDIRHISESLGEKGTITKNVLREVWQIPASNPYYRTVAMWLYYGKGTVFIQDANSLVLSTSELLDLFSYLTKKIPGIRRITSYARSSTLARRSVKELSELREAGLDRIHIGLESGSDTVLKFTQKGATASKHVSAGQRVKEAGICLSEYIMPGLGGEKWWKEHAIETAKVLNQINPDFIRLRSLRVPQHSPLFKDLMAGRFVPLHDDAIIQDIRLLIQSLEGITSTLTSHHIMNLLEEVEGRFPEDKEAMLAVIDHYLSLPDKEKLLFRLGRRGGAFRSLHDLHNLPLRQKIENALSCLEHENPGKIDDIIDELGNQYI